MAYEMYLKMNPTDSNRAAAAEFGPTFAKLFLSQIRDAEKRLTELAAQPTATPEQIMGAVLAWRSGQPGITDSEHQLIGSAVLGGAAVTTTATKLGVRPQTLSAWLAKTVAAVRGKELHFDHDAHEWKTR